jgi:hypothetical protein
MDGSSSTGNDGHRRALLSRWCAPPRPDAPPRAPHGRMHRRRHGLLPWPDASVRPLTGGCAAAAMASSRSSASRTPSSPSYLCAVAAAPAPVGDSPRGPLKQRGNPHLKPATKPKHNLPNHAGNSPRRRDPDGPSRRPS